MRSMLKMSIIDSRGGADALRITLHAICWRDPYGALARWADDGGRVL